MPDNGQPDSSLFEFVQMDEDIRDTRMEGKPVGFLGDVLRRLVRNRSAIFSGSVILLIIVMSIIGPALTPYTFREQNLNYANLPPRIPFLEKYGICDGRKLYEVQEKNLESRFGDAVIGIVSSREYEYKGKTIKMVTAEVDTYKAAGAADKYFYFGTDALGRDLWTRLWRGARVSLLLGFFSAIINTTVGVIYGSTAGYYGGKTDLIMMRIVEIINGLPYLVIVILFVMMLGTGLGTFVLALVLFGWTGTSVMIRAQFYKYKEYDYVLASRTMGAPDRRLIFRHILPNAIGPIITAATLAIPSAIFSESFLSFLGLGIQAPEPSIGVLLADGQKVILNYPYTAIIPAIVISVLMLSFNTFGNALRDSFDPSLRGK